MGLSGVLRRAKRQSRVRIGNLIRSAIRLDLLSGTLRTLLYLALRTATVGSPIFLEMPLFMGLIALIFQNLLLYVSIISYLCKVNKYYDDATPSSFVIYPFVFFAAPCRGRRD
jgi:hypothetical protein